MALESKVKKKNIVKFCLITCNANSSCVFDGVCSYLARLHRACL